ncbi:MAG: DUF6110 family protein [Defluviitaleaceae bacterium]|nr:DUF6110 family protein [Defluviitaleaceae bacterium]
MIKLLSNEKFLYFMGGVASVCLGSKILKSKKSREIVVNTVAKGMKLQKNAAVTMQNIKEEAQDICHEAKNINAISYIETDETNLEEIEKI